VCGDERSVTEQLTVMSVCFKWWLCVACCGGVDVFWNSITTSL
jgi:hypothetical protein